MHNVSVPFEDVDSSIMAVCNPVFMTLDCAWAENREKWIDKITLFVII